MQNSQRVRDAKPRTAPMARRRDGDIAPYRQAAREVRTATGRTRRHGEGAREVCVITGRAAVRGSRRPSFRMDKQMQLIENAKFIHKT